MNRATTINEIGFIYDNFFQEYEQKHEAYRWCSQPVSNRHLHGGVLQIASALLCSGNNFSKMALYAKFLRLYFPGKVKFSNIQRTYLVPTFNPFWMESQRQVVESISGRSVDALGMCYITELVFCQVVSCMLENFIILLFNFSYVR